MREKGSGTAAAVESALRRQWITTSDLKVCTTISSSEAMKQAVLAGCGVAFISEMAVREELKQGTLVAIDLPELIITRSFSVVHKKGRSLSPAATAFQHVLSQVKT